LGIIISFVSGKGGTGKTTCAAAVASCLAALGHNTLAVDCDAGMRNLDLSLGMAEFAITDFSDIIEGGASLKEVACRHPSLDHLSFLAAPPHRSADEINPALFSRLLAGAKKEYEFVLTDSPAGIGAGFLLAARDCDIAMLITTPDSSAVRDASKTAQELQSLGISSQRLIINRCKISDKIIDSIIDDVGVRLAGTVRYDAKVPKSAEAGAALVLGTTGGAARDFLDITLRLLENL